MDEILEILADGYTTVNTLENGYYSYGVASDGSGNVYFVNDSNQTIVTAPLPAPIVDLSRDRRGQQ